MERAVGGLDQLQEERERGVNPALVDTEPALPSVVPDDVLVEGLAHGIHVTGVEGIVATPEKGCVWVLHCSRRHRLSLLSHPGGWGRNDPTPAGPESTSLPVSLNGRCHGIPPSAAAPGSPRRSWRSSTSGSAPACSSAPSSGGRTPSPSSSMRGRRRPMAF